VCLPTVGRFLQVDPVDGGSLNSYDYANQDPLNQQDLTGDFSVKGVWEMTTGFAGIAAGVAVQAVCTAATDGLGAFHCLTATGSPIAGGATLFSAGLDDFLGGKRKKVEVKIRLKHRKGWGCRPERYSGKQRADYKR
jgi:hypothetical protein